MALHLFRHKQRFPFNSSLFCIFPTSQTPSSNFTLNRKPLFDSHRKYSSPRDSGDFFDRFVMGGRHLREHPEEIQSIVTRTEQPKNEKQRKAGRPKKQPLEQKPMVETQSRAARLSGHRRKNVTASSSYPRNELKNHPDYTWSVTHAMEVLNGLSRIKKWSPLYRASMDHLMADVAHRQAFLTFSDPEDRIRYLRYKTKKIER